MPFAVFPTPMQLAPSTAPPTTPPASGANFAMLTIPFSPAFVIRRSARSAALLSIRTAGLER
jgi:hypothetical protein